MRLSEKGCVHLNEWMVHKLPIDAFEFKPEDFTGTVVLTTKEARTILGILKNFVGPFDVEDEDNEAISKLEFLVCKARANGEMR